jgi:hypothetical protein
MKTKIDPNQQWKTSILNLIAEQDSGELFCADTIRLEANNHCIPAPPSPALWGAVFHAAAYKHRLIRPTGRCSKSMLNSAHRRNLLVWKRTSVEFTA